MDRPWTLAIPLGFAAFGLLETLLWRRLRASAYPWAEGLASLGVAAGQVVKRLLLGGAVLGLFQLVWGWRLWTIPLDTAWGIGLLFLAFEFVYYWEHRMSHRIRWFWATHAVHHSSNHLTLLAALRLGWTAELSGSFLPFLALPLLGFHPLGVVAALGLSLLYQFWLHTELVPRLGWLEGVFNTPSNHRVHHARDAAYLDRNFGGVLMLFDRLFGTYAAEDGPCRFGLTRPLESCNPVTIALHEWCRLGRDVRAAPGLRERLAVLFGPPEGDLPRQP
jgi:sterol desaturase/sphingolipid hydroxylase (fatty acid hydroxylase superfamily)